MGWQPQILTQLLKRIRAGISRRVHDQRVQTRLQIGTSMALGVGLLIATALFLRVFDFPQSAVADLFYQPFNPSNQVILVAIDDASISKLGNWPWRRSTLANLIDAVAQARPRVIALDLLLSEPSDDDQVLASSLERGPRIIQSVIGAESLRLSATGNIFPRYDTALMPAPALRTSNTQLANAMIVPDADGVVRRIPVLTQVGDRRYPTLGIAALEAFTGQTLALEIENGKMAWGTLELPVDSQGQMPINFTTGQPIFSAMDVINGQVAPDSLRNKIVLIGLINSAARQELRIPLLMGSQPRMPVEIHADVIDMILGNHLLLEQDRLTEIILIFLVALMAGATLPHVRVLTACGLTLVYALMYVSYTIQKFADGVLVKPVYPILAIMITATLTILYQYFSEERHRASLGRLFRRYVSPELIDQVLRASDAGALPLGGIRRDVSVLYVDLRELGGIAATLNAQAVMTLLNEYITLIVTAVFRHEGSIAKRSGDTLLAVWNLPLDQNDYAARAARAALDIWREATELRRRQPEELAIRIGMGIATGPIAAGHIGTSTQEEFILVGQVVGMAERMALKPNRGVYIDAETRQKIESQFETYPANPIRLRRQTDPVEVWLLIDPTEMQDQANDEAKAQESK